MTDTDEDEFGSDAYRLFLEAKVRMAPSSGLEIALTDLQPRTLGTPHVAAGVQWAARGGRRAIFAAFGLHKTAWQIELMRTIRAKVGGMSLITLPLGVRDEFIQEAAKLDEPVRFIRHSDEARPDCTNLTNYEAVREGNVDPRLFQHASLDEASVLRSFGSKTYQTFLPLYAETPFRFVATATPSPNRYKELIHYAGYLGVMDTGQALTRFFQRNPKKAGDLTLYPHKEEEFWLWCASWGLFIQRPSDLGFSDDGYEMPPLVVRWHEVPASGVTLPAPDREGQGSLLPERAIGLVDAAREKRSSLQVRLAKAAEIVGTSPGDNFIIWHDLEDERAELERLQPDMVSVYGTQDLEAREHAIRMFSQGWVRNIGSKPVLMGSGCNLQHHCHRQVFSGIGFKFNDFIQAIYRVLRFGQQHQVEIDIIYTEAEREVRRELEAKWLRDTELRERMSQIIRQYGLNQLAMAETLTRSIGVNRLEVCSPTGAWRVANNDCVDEAGRLDEASLDLVVSSIPFSNHYEYTPKYDDFGHTQSNDHFWAQMDFLTPKLLRALKPGRLACVHVKDRILFGKVTGEGVPTISPFHAEAIFHYLRHGFQYLGMHDVQTDVVSENAQSYRLGYTEMCKDGSKMGCGSPEYVLLVRKPQSDKAKSYGDVRIEKDKADYSLARWQIDAHAFWRSSGDRLLTPEEWAALVLQKDGLSKVKALWAAHSRSARPYDYEYHVKVGEALQMTGKLPSSWALIEAQSRDDRVWTNVDRLHSLNGAQASAGREKHICPLPFDIVNRLIERYSEPGDLVFDPFGGLGTVPYCAVKLGRRGASSELNDLYFRDSVNFLRALEAGADVPSLFDALEVAA